MAVDILTIERAQGGAAALRADVRAFADRKVARLLTPVTMAPFVASLRALAAVADLPREAVGLYTVSSWEGPSDESAVPGSNPTDFLRSMANAPLCQIAIAGGLCGPNSHLVGGGDALWGAVMLAEHDLRAGEADAVVITGFDAVGTGDVCGAALSIVVRAVAPRPEGSTAAGGRFRFVDTDRGQTILEALEAMTATFPSETVVDVRQGALA